MNERRKKINTEQYKEYNQLVKWKCSEVKAWINNKCEEIEELTIKNPKKVYDIIKDMWKKILTGLNLSTGHFKRESGKIILDEEEKLMKELYKDESLSKWKKNKLVYFLLAILQPYRLQRRVVKRGFSIVS